MTVTVIKRRLRERSSRVLQGIVTCTGGQPTGDGCHVGRQKVLHLHLLVALEDAIVVVVTAVVLAGSGRAAKGGACAMISDMYKASCF